MYKVKGYINVDNAILGGNPVFKGTRVPIETLFMHLEKGIPLEHFLEDFPTVRKEQAIAVIEIASKILTSRNKKSMKPLLDENLPKRLKQDLGEHAFFCP